MIWFASYIHLYTTILNIQKEIDFPMLQLVLSSFLATAAFKATCARWQKKTGMPRRDRCGCRKWDCSWRMNHLSWQIIKHLEKAVSINKQLPFLFFPRSICDQEASTFLQPWEKPMFLERFLEGLLQKWTHKSLLATKSAVALPFANNRRAGS